MLDNKTRLNAAIRQHIVDKALDTAGCDAADVKLIDDRAAFAEKVRQVCLAQSGVTDAMLRKEYDRVRKLVSNEQLNNFLYVSVGVNSSELTVNLNGQSRTLYLSGATNRYDRTHIEVKDMAEGGVACPRTRLNIARPELLDELIELDKRQQVNADKRREVETTVAAAVKRAVTVGKLLEAWPAAVELLPEEYVKEQSRALALNPAALNALCGIPSPK